MAAATSTITTRRETFSGQDYFPEGMGRQQFYDPPERGFEREIKKRLEYWAKLRKERGSCNRRLRGTMLACLLLACDRHAGIGARRRGTLGAVLGRVQR